MSERQSSEAWVRLASDKEIQAAFDGQSHPYTVFMGGVIPHMTRLIMAHDLIGPAFGMLSSVVLFGPGALSRSEREMVAGVAAAAQDCVY